MRTIQPYFQENNRNYYDDDDDNTMYARTQSSRTEKFFLIHLMGGRIKKTSITKNEIEMSAVHPRSVGRVLVYIRDVYIILYNSHPYFATQVQLKIFANGNNEKTLLQGPERKIHLTRVPWFFCPEGRRTNFSLDR